MDRRRSKPKPRVDRTNDGGYVLRRYLRRDTCAIEQALAARPHGHVAMLRRGRP